ncbi:MAG: glycosyltransferase family 2 protein [bacterium]
MTLEKSLHRFPMVCALIPNWNGRQHILACLQSLSGLHYPKECLQVLVIDNGSTDGSVEAIEKFFKEMSLRGFRYNALIKNIENLGAPAAYNQGLRAAHADVEFFWKLDNDVVVAPDCLGEFVRHMLSAPENAAGVTGRYINSRSGREEFSGAIYLQPPRRWTKILHPVTATDIEKHRVDCSKLVMISGGCFLFRRSLVEVYGEFDERFFLYYDDTEFCVRLALRGFRFAIIPRCTIHHYGSASSHSGDMIKVYYGTRNHLLFGTLIFQWWERMLFLSLQLAAIPWKLYRVVLQKEGGGKGAALRAFLDAIVDWICMRYGKWQKME